MQKVKEIFENIFFRIIVLIIIGISATLLLYYFCFGGDGGLLKWCDSFFIVGAAIFLFGCFQIVCNQGMFDLFNYSVANMWSVFVLREDKHYVDAIDYRDQKSESRKKHKFYFIIYFVVGIIFMIVSLILYIILKKQMS